MSRPREGAQHFGVHWCSLRRKQVLTGVVTMAAATPRERPERYRGGQLVLARELDAGQSSRARLPAAAVAAHSIRRFVEWVFFMRTSSVLALESS
jgi:hypothetical protein